MKGAFSGFGSRTVIVVGDALLDVYFLGEVRRISPEAPVPIVRVREKTLTLGGAGNVALNVAGLRSHAVLFGMRGDDAAGTQLADVLKQRGIEDCVAVDPSRFTTSKTRVIGHGQQLLRLDEEETRPMSAPVRRQVITRFEALLPRADAVVLSDYNKGVLTGEVSRDIITLCRGAGIPVLVDPKGKDWERYHGATCITPNTAEIEHAIGHAVDDDEDALVKAGEALRKRYDFQWMLVTRGPKGMCLLGAGEPPLFIRATAREVYDVTGAGDTVIATLAVGTASRLPIQASATLANAAAGIVVGKVGSQAVTYEELETALRIDGVDQRGHGVSKVTTLEAAEVQIRTWQAANERILFTTGTFDRLHPGNVYLLRQAKALGGRVVVGLPRHSRSSAGTGRPAATGHDRAYIVSALDCVDLVFVIDGDAASAVELLRPDTLVVAAGRAPENVFGASVAERYHGRVHYVPILGDYAEASMTPVEATAAVTR